MVRFSHYEESQDGDFLEKINDDSSQALSKGYERKGPAVRGAGRTDATAITLKDGTRVRLTEETYQMVSFTSFCVR